MQLPSDPMPAGFHFGLPEVEMVLLATAIISAIAAIRYRRPTSKGRQAAADHSTLDESPL